MGDKKQYDFFKNDDSDSSYEWDDNEVPELKY